MNHEKFQTGLTVHSDPCLPAPGIENGYKTNQTQRESGKTRSSCTNCAQHKVRCDKKKPFCNRCTRNGKSCQYIRSRRFGRKPKKGASSTSVKSHAAKESLAPLTPQSWPESGDEETRRKIVANSRFPPSEIDAGLSELQLAGILPVSDPNALPLARTGYENDGETLGTVESSFLDVDPRKLGLDHQISTIEPGQDSVFMPHSGPFASSISTASPESTQSFGSIPPDMPFCPRPTWLKHDQAQDLAKADSRPGCDCIEQLLATFTSQAGSQKYHELDRISGLSEEYPPALLSFQHATKTCERVLSCSCLAQDERVTTLLSLVILDQLRQDSSVKSDSDATMATFAKYRSLARSLAARLQACQPGFARATSGIFAQFWFATSGSSVK